METEISAIAKKMYPQLVAWRQDFHMYPEAGWMEFRTASLVAQELSQLGYKIRLGREVISEASRQGVPSANELDKAWQQARKEGAPAEFVESMKGGFTGVVGILEGSSPGPTVALRFDMDANDIGESTSQNHRPFREGFSSRHPGITHACGHDGHVAIGLGVANILAQIQSKLCGRVLLVFQPAEEGVRGAKSMVAAEVLADCQYFLSGHLGFGNDTLGEIGCGQEKFLATTKVDALFTGQAAHAGMNPDAGKNALLAAALAALSIHAIPRHEGGADRINVGYLVAGSGRNVVPDRAELRMETRGETTEINRDMEERARGSLLGAAQMQQVDCQVNLVGSAPTAKSSPALVSRIRKLAQAQPWFKCFVPEARFSGSEDVAYMMRSVQEQGGQAAYIVFGTPVGTGHHTGQFDFDEEVLAQAVTLYSLLIAELMVSPRQPCERTRSRA
jgi:aminobenzoyl-glutamate utilization protein A